MENKFTSTAVHSGLFSGQTMPEVFSSAEET